MPDLPCGPVDLQQLRTWLRGLNHAELRRFSKAASFLCSGPSAEAPRETFVKQLEEAQAEWQRRQADSGSL